MCTASWIARPGGYELFFNRDERRTRLPGRPPIPRDSGGTAYLAPLDGDALGTWIGVNRHGLSLALLNGFPIDGADAVRPAIEPDEANWISRGHVIPRLMTADSASAALDALARLPLERFRALQLLALDAEGGRAVADWSGASLDSRLDTRAPDPPLISSSFCTEAVRASRLGVWNALVESERTAEPASRLRFHRSHLPQRGPHSVCMHRPDARTVSFTRIAVDRQTVMLEYTPDAPCRGKAEFVLRLERGPAVDTKVEDVSEA